MSKPAIQSLKFALSEIVPAGFDWRPRTRDFVKRDRDSWSFVAVQLSRRQATPSVTLQFAVALTCLHRDLTDFHFPFITVNDGMMDWSKSLAGYWGWKKGWIPLEPDGTLRDETIESVRSVVVGQAMPELCAACDPQHLLRMWVQGEGEGLNWLPRLARGLELASMLGSYAAFDALRSQSFVAYPQGGMRRELDTVIQGIQAKTGWS